MNPGGPSASASAEATADQRGAAPEFPVGLRVLLVEDDRVNHIIVSKMLEQCRYQVSVYESPAVALAMLRKGTQSFDLVLSDINMTDEDGFKLLESIGLETNLPVIMMSGDEHTDAVLKGVMHGACDYLVKPVRMETLKNIWHHVARRRKHASKGQQSEDGENQIRARTLEDGDNTSPRNGAKRKGAEACEDPSHRVKKQRFVWCHKMNQLFIDAVEALGGPENAFPKKILEKMAIPRLTRENVASHLQKYRINLKKEEEQKKQQQEIATFSGVNGFNSQAYSSSQIMPQSVLQPEAVNTFVDTFVDANQVALNVQVVIPPMQQVNNRLPNHLINRATDINIVDLRQYEHLQPYGNTFAFMEHHELMFPLTLSHQRSFNDLSNHFSQNYGANNGACTTSTRMSGANEYGTAFTRMCGANACACTGNHATSTNVQNASTIGPSESDYPSDQLQSERFNSSHQPCQNSYTVEASLFVHQQDSIWDNILSTINADNIFQNNNTENSCRLNTKFNEHVNRVNKGKAKEGKP